MQGKLGRLGLLTTDQYRNGVIKWLRALRRKESVAISFIPKTDRIIRLEQLLNDKVLMRSVLGTRSLHIFQLVDFTSSTIEDQEDLYYQIGNHLNSSRIAEKKLTFVGWMNYLKSKDATLVLTIVEGEKLLNPANSHILTLLSYAVDEHFPSIRILTIFETDITHPTVVAYLPSSTRLYQNIYNYPLYSQEDTRKFVALLEHQYRIPMAAKVKDDIVKRCGGHFWFVKEAVRGIASSGTWSPEDEGMIFRLRTVFHSLLDSEQSLLKKLAMGKSDFTREEKVSIVYLKRMRVINEQNKCTIDILNDFIVKHEEPISTITFADNRLSINNVPIDSFFSKKEHRVIKLLVEKANKIVTREEIALRIWPKDTHEQYSDWAIDQIIARVRKRLGELSLSASNLKVVRGKGYLLTQPTP